VVTNHSEVEGNIYLGYGAMFLISPLFLKKMGGLPVKTFLYQEESVICGYARRFGCWPYFIPTLKTYHESHSTLRYIGFERDYQLRRDAWWATRDML
jgi:GT2 family glycosyltransferase